MKRLMMVVLAMVVLFGCWVEVKGAEALLFQVESEHVIPAQSFTYVFQVLGDNPGEIIWNVDAPSLEVLASSNQAYGLTEQLKTSKPEDMLRITVYPPLSDVWKPFGFDVSEDLMTRYVISQVGTKFIMQGYGIEGGAIPEPTTIMGVVLWLISMVSVRTARPERV